VIVRELPPAAGLPLCLNDFFKEGKYTLETMLASYLDVPYVQIGSSAAACLIVALSTLKKFSPRNEVIVPAFCCPRVIHAINQSGLKVRVCDTQVDHFDFDYEQLALLAGEQTLCIILTHLGGIPADLLKATRIARQHGAFIVEDASQSLGARHLGQPVGTIGDIGIYSLNSVKGFNILEVGALVSHNGHLQSALAETGRRLLRQRPKLELTKIVETISSCFLYNPLGLSITYGAELRQWLAKGDPQRAIGDVFAPPVKMHKVSDFRKRVAANAFFRFPLFQSRCRNVALQRIEKFATISGITTITEGYGCEGTYPYLTLVFEKATDCEAVLNEMWTQGMGVSKIFYKSASEDEHLVNFVQSARSPEAASFARRSITISNSPMMSNQDFQNIYDTILSVLEDSSENSEPELMTQEADSFETVEQLRFSP
jgi:perosamine synthetase